MGCDGTVLDKAISCGTVVVESGRNRVQLRVRRVESNCMGSGTEGLKAGYTAGELLRWAGMPISIVKCGWLFA